jgi:hypothetical protein
MQLLPGVVNFVLENLFTLTMDMDTFIVSQNYKKEIKNNAKNTSIQLNPSISKSALLEGETVESILESKVKVSDIEEQDPFYVADLGEVERQYQQWIKLMPRVRPFFGTFLLMEPSNATLIHTLLKLLLVAGLGLTVQVKVK